MARLLLLLAFALCGLSQAHAEPRIELSATPAWKGWTRPGRTTEVDIRLNSAAATRATLDVAAGRESIGAAVELQPGRVARLQIAIGSAPTVGVSVTTSGPVERRNLTLSQSESPLLGVALAGDAHVELEGFHAIALGVDDLPRNASAYSSIDALILDMAILGALDQRQLAALVNYAGTCGRLAVIDTDARVRQLLDGAGGCSGRGVMHASSPADAKALLSASLSKSLPPALSLGSVGALARPGYAVWNIVAVILAVYFAAAAVALIQFPSLPVILAAPLLAGLAALALLQGVSPKSQLIVWSEGESAAQLARYQAWQRFPGIVRERVRVPLPPQLGSDVHACEPGQEMRFEVDATGARALFAEFETQLFRQVALCYVGTFPMARSIEVEARPGGSHEARNTGARAWPSGVLLLGGLVHDLPAIAPGAAAVIAADSRRPVGDAALRLASTRALAKGAAALWALDLAGVAGAPVDSTAWLLVSTVPSR